MGYICIAFPHYKSFTSTQMSSLIVFTVRYIFTSYVSTYLVEVIWSHVRREVPAGGRGVVEKAREALLLAAVRWRRHVRHSPQVSLGRLSLSVGHVITV